MKRNKKTIKKLISILFILVSISFYCIFKDKEVKKINLKEEVSSEKTQKIDKKNEESYIASFNILRLGEAKKDLNFTANLIKKFDIVGLVEVMNRNGVEDLVESLNRNSNYKWSYHISTHGVGSKKYKEYFAYVYKKDKVKFIKSEGFYKNGKSSLLREPYGATFKIENFDFTLVLVHTIHGKSKEERKVENYKMIQVYNYFQDRDKNENDILIAGDFNLYALDRAFRPLLSHEDKITYAIDPSIKTTIGNRGRANSYDNFFLSTKYTKEFTGFSGGIDFSGNNPKKMRKIISDHIPIFITVNTLEDDD